MVAERAQAHAGRESPDRVEVGAGRPEEGEAVALGLRERAFVGQDVARAGRIGELERAEDAVGRAGASGVVVKTHPVSVEPGFGVGGEEAVGLPVGEKLGGGGVSGLDRTVGKDQLDRVADVATRERHAFVVVDHVVGWCGHRGEIVGRVAQAAERKKSGHVEVPFEASTRRRLVQTERLSHTPTSRSTSWTPTAERTPTTSPTTTGVGATRRSRRSTRDPGCSPSANVHAAVVALERARDLEPDAPSVRETFARAYFRSGRFTAATEEFERSVGARPGQRLRALRPGTVPVARG